MTQFNLKDRLSNLIKEAVDDARAMKAGATAPVAPPAHAATQPTAQPAPAQPVGAETGEKLANADIETKDVIEKLNSIRAGRSFKDSAVAEPMTAYVDGLDGAEKTALYAFLSGIAQIVTGEVAGDTATEPKDTPADVEMQKSVDGQPAAQPGTAHVKPKVIGKSTAPAAPRARPENTAAPKPVVPRNR